MPTYVYETIPGDAATPVRQFEIFQRMSDAALTKDPDSGLPVRRIISGGAGVTGLSPKGDSAAGGSACQPGCGCH